MLGEEISRRYPIFMAGQVRPYPEASIVEDGTKTELVEGTVPKVPRSEAKRHLTILHFNVM